MCQRTPNISATALISLFSIILSSHHSSEQHVVSVLILCCMPCAFGAEVIDNEVDDVVQQAPFEPELRVHVKGFQSLNLRQLHDLACHLFCVSQAASIGVHLSDDGLGLLGGSCRL